MNYQTIVNNIIVRAKISKIFKATVWYQVNSSERQILSKIWKNLKSLKRNLDHEAGPNREFMRLLVSK